MKFLFSISAFCFVFLFCLTVPGEYCKNRPGSSDPDVRDNVSATPDPSKHDTAMVVLNDLSDLFVYDMKYATPDNFLKEKVYDCDNCMVRYSVARALIKAAGLFGERGFQIKFFDCTRPVEVQKKMWEILPDGRYVANPYRSGSIHNRGAAVDITLVDSLGNELNMGTSFDHFGEEAHHSYLSLPDTVLANRRYLSETMQAAGFSPIRTEWWHYNYSAAKYNISSVALCN